MALKYSRQRESIKNYLANTTEHPTADTVYTNIRKKYPNISLGTIYRNLNLLVEQGEVTKFTTGYGSDRFDSNTKPHYHFLCTECSEVLDIFVENKFVNTINEAVSSGFDGEILGHNTLFYGLCCECKNFQDKNSEQTEPLK